MKLHYYQNRLRSAPVMYVGKLKELSSAPIMYAGGMPTNEIARLPLEHGLYKQDDPLRFFSCVSKLNHATQSFKQRSQEGRQG